MSVGADRRHGQMTLKAAERWFCVWPCRLAGSPTTDDRRPGWLPAAPPSPPGEVQQRKRRGTPEVKTGGEAAPEPAGETSSFIRATRGRPAWFRLASDY